MFSSLIALLADRLTAIFDSCHSQTVLDLPFIYDCYGNIKKQKVSRKKAGMAVFETGYALKQGNLLGVLSSGKQALDSIVNIGNEGKAQKITEQTRYVVFLPLGWQINFGPILCPIFHFWAGFSVQNSEGNSMGNFAA